MSYSNCETHSAVAGQQLSAVGQYLEGCACMANYWLDYKVISVVYCSLLRYTDLIICNAFARRYKEFDTLPLLQCTLGVTVISLPMPPS